MLCLGSGFYSQTYPILKEEIVYETHISTQQCEQKKDPWLSGPLPNQRWPGGIAQKKGQGPEAFGSIGLFAGYEKTVIKARGKMRAKMLTDYSFLRPPLLDPGGVGAVSRFSGLGICTPKAGWTNR